MSRFRNSNEPMKSVKIIFFLIVIKGKRKKNIIILTKRRKNHSKMWGPFIFIVNVCFVILKNTSSFLYFSLIFLRQNGKDAFLLKNNHTFYANVSNSQNDNHANTLHTVCYTKSFVSFGEKKFEGRKMRKETKRRKKKSELKGRKIKMSSYRRIFITFCILIPHSFIHSSHILRIRKIFILDKRWISTHKNMKKKYI